MTDQAPDDNDLICDAAGLAQLAPLEAQHMFRYCQPGMAAVEEARSASSI